MLKFDSLPAFRNRKEQFVQLLAVHRIDTLVLLSINLGRQFTGQRVSHSGPYWDGIFKHRLLQTYSSLQRTLKARLMSVRILIGPRLVHVNSKPPLGQ